MSRRYLVIGEIIFIAAVCVAAYVLFRRHVPAANAVRVEIQLPGSQSPVYLQRQSDGGLVYLISRADGSLERLASAEMSERLYKAGSEKRALSILDFSNPVVVLWLGIGLLGQLLFTGRMVVQWIASERRGKSVVPPLFWWMSLVGSLLLLAYFLWRRDPIGLLGQAFGSFVYLKNIMWILGESRQPATLVAA